MFYDIFKKLCDKSGVSPSKAATDVGIDKSNVSKWKTKSLTPRGDALNRIAEYFNVSVDYLLGKEQVDDTQEEVSLESDNAKKNPLTDERQGEIIRVLDKIGALTEDGKLSERGRKIITEFLDNNAEMLKKVFNEDT